jgi:hypothetical protein
VESYLRRIPGVVAPAKERRAKRRPVHAHGVTIFDFAKQLRGVCNTTQRGGALLVGRVEKEACVSQAPDASGGRQHGAHGVDVEQDSEAAGAAATDDDFGGGVKAVSAGGINCNRDWAALLGGTCL